MLQADIILETALLITRLKNYLFTLEEIKVILTNWQDADLFQAKMKTKQENLTQQITCYFVRVIYV